MKQNWTNPPVTDGKRNAAAQDSMTNDIIYWLPKMQDNPYNVITLHTDDYARSVPLTVSPAPDAQIRVFMTYYSSNTPVDIQEQELPHYERNGFTHVEWGGSEG